MNLNIVWLPLSSRVGTIEIGAKILSLLQKKREVYHLGVGDYILNKKSKRIFENNNLLSKNVIKISLNLSNILFGRFTVAIQSFIGFTIIIKLLLLGKYKKLVVYTLLFPLPFLIFKVFLKLVNLESFLIIYNFPQGTPSFLRPKYINKENLFLKLENNVRKIIYSILYNYSNKVICSSYRLANNLKDRINNKLILVIPNGVLNKMPNKNKLKNILENNEDKYLYLYFIGRLTYQKNIALLISKFKELYENKKNISLTIIGDGDQFDSLYSIYSNIENIFFKGYVADPWKKIRDDGIIIVPSIWEEPGHVAIEAFMNNKRFMISNGCSLSDFIPKECNSSIVFNPNNLEDVLINIRKRMDPKIWIKNHNELKKSLDVFSDKQFEKSINEL